MKKTALLIIPTYNEAKNIGPLLTQLYNLTELDAMGWRLDVLVMDDTSPDGTSQIVQKLADGKYKGRLFLHTGKKQGLGRALQKSFDAALTYNHDAILTMDADFSHDPGDIPGLLAAIDDGADVAIGSRYIDGGLIPGNWPLSLIIRTRIATMVARWLGGVSNDIHELTTNFRAMRRHVLESIKYNSVRANGYGIQIFLANAFTSRDFKVAEVPITFRSRAHGSSKARFKDIIEFFTIAYNLNPDSPAKQVMRFLAVGMSGTFVNLLALWQLRHLTDSTLPYISFLAIQISIMWNFTLHNMFTFRAYRKATKGRRVTGLTRNFFLYEGASLFTQIIILSVYTLLTWAGAYFVVAQLVGIGSAFIVNYYISSRYIWVLTRAYAH